VTASRRLQSFHPRVPRGLRGALPRAMEADAAGALISP
jgi:hypothetical protein